MSPSPEAPSELRPEVLFILLALSRRPRHGYALIDAVERESSGEVRVRVGSLYRVIGRLLDDGWIREVEAPAGEGSTDSRRRYYDVTPSGRAVLSAEIARLKRIVSRAEALRGPVAKGS